LPDWAINRQLGYSRASRGDKKYDLAIYRRLGDKQFLFERFWAIAIKKEKKLCDLDYMQYFSMP